MRVSSAYKTVELDEFLHGSVTQRVASTAVNAPDFANKLRDVTTDSFCASEATARGRELGMILSGLFRSPYQVLIVFHSSRSRNSVEVLILKCIHELNLVAFDWNASCSDFHHYWIGFEVAAVHQYSMSDLNDHQVPISPPPTMRSQTPLERRAQQCNDK